MRNRSGTQVTLHPGQVAKIPRFIKSELSVLQNKIQVDQTNLNHAIAWQKGFLYISNGPIASVVKDIGRLYNLEMINTELLPKNGCGCYMYICRNMSTGEVLHLLKSWGLRFEQEGNKVVFRKKEKINWKLFNF